MTSKGLGYPIFTALRDPTPFKTEIYAAGLLAVVLAITADLLFVAFAALPSRGRGPAR